MRFKRFICFYEGVYVDKDKLVFDYGSDKGIPTDFGKFKSKKPFKHSLKAIGSKGNVYSIYNKFDDKTFKILKGKNPNININKQDYNHFLKRSAVYIGRLLRKSKTDVIITPQSSSKLLSDLLDKLEKMRPSILFLPNKFKKVDMNKIEIDENLLRKKVKNEKQREKIIKELTKAINKAKKEGYFQMKSVRGPVRKFLKNFFDFVDKEKLNKIEDMNIMIIDDVLTTGASVRDMINKLSFYNPASVNAISLFKSSGH